MGIVENILIGIYAVICLAIIILALIQSKEDQGASGTIVGGSSSSSFFEKNKGRTKEGKLKKWTIILSIIFAILTIIIGIIYMI